MKGKYRITAIILAAAVILTGVLAACAPKKDEESGTTNAPAASQRTHAESVPIFKDDKALEDFQNGLKDSTLELGGLYFYNEFEENGSSNLIESKLLDQGSERGGYGKTLEHRGYTINLRRDFEGQSIVCFEVKNADGETVSSVYPFEYDEDYSLEEYILYGDYLILNIAYMGYVKDYGLCNEKNIVQIYDVKSPESPRLVTSYAQSGRYDKLFIANETLYVMSQFCVADVNDDMRPRSGADGKYDLVPANNIAYFENAGSKFYTVIGAIDMKTCKEAKQTVAVLGAFWNTHISENNIYLTDNLNGKDGFSLMRIDIASDEFYFAALGKVGKAEYGMVAVNEYGGKVRVVYEEKQTVYEMTDDNRYTDKVLSPSISRIAVLDMDMNVLCTSDELSGYSIYEVGFDGAKAYIYDCKDSDPSETFKTHTIDFTDSGKVTVEKI